MPISAAASRLALATEYFPSPIRSSRRAGWTGRPRVCTDLKWPKGAAEQGVEGEQSDLCVKRLVPHIERALSQLGRATPVHVPLLDHPGGVFSPGQRDLDREVVRLLPLSWPTVAVLDGILGVLYHAPDRLTLT